MSVLALLPDAWMAWLISRLLPDSAVATFGFGPERDRLRGDRHVVVPPVGDQSAVELLNDPAVRALIDKGTEVLTFKPSRRVQDGVQALGGHVLLAEAALARGLENKNLLPTLAREAGVEIPTQASYARAEALDFVALRERFGAPFVAQSPRGFMGRRTFAVYSEEQWSTLRQELGPRPVKIAALVRGRPATVNAVVDHAGACVVTAPIVQVTGVPWLTPFPLGSCGNDFCWRGGPDPGEGPAIVAERIGAAIAARGYRGHFGIDLVVEDGRSWLIEVNPRLTASFALYSAFQPRLLDAHLHAVRGDRIEAARLQAFDGGQLIVHHLTEDPGEPIAGGPFPIGVHPDTLVGTTLWPYPGPVVPFAGTRARLITRGPVVDAAGELLTPWRP